MKLRNTVLGFIRELEKIELEHCNTLRSSIVGKSQNKSLLNDPKYLIRYINCYPSNYSNQHLVNGDWANSVDGVSITSQLMCNPNLIVDLVPNLRTNQDLIVRYGLSVQQLLVLARQGEITLNLLAYESTKFENFEAYLHFDGSEEEKSAYADLFLFENGMRINSLRRKLFFDLKLGDSGIKYDDFVEKGREIFSAIKNLPTSEKGRIEQNPIFRRMPLNELVESLSQQYAYNGSMVSLGFASDEASTISRLLEPKTLFEREIIKYLEILRGLKVLISSPILAPLGGNYCMSNSSVAALKNLNSVFGNLAGNDFEIRENVKLNLENISLVEKRKEKILSAILKKKKLLEINSIKTPIYFNDSQFKEYLDFIRNKKKSRQELSFSIERLAQNPYLTDERMDYVEQCILSQKDLFKNYEIFKKTLNSSVEQSIPVLSGVFLGYLASNSILISLISGQITALVTKTLISDKALNSCFEFFFKNKHQVIMEVEGIKKLII